MLAVLYSTKLNVRGKERTEFGIIVKLVSSHERAEPLSCFNRCFAGTLIHCQFGIKFDCEKFDTVTGRVDSRDGGKCFLCAVEYNSVRLSPPV